VNNHDATPAAVPSWVKVTHTTFVGVLVPVYWRQYGPGNFLWFSDVALLTSVPALWLESSLLASTQAVAVLVPETVWLVDFASGVLTRRTPIGLASYMFDRRLSRFVRALSLFHLWLTPLLVFVVSRVGYDRRALKYQTGATVAILLASWRLTKPEDNVNWVYSRREIRTSVARAAFVGCLMIAIPLLFHLPAHRLLRRLFPPPVHASETVSQHRAPRRPRLRA
jgi:hypothetical protein